MGYGLVLVFDGVTEADYRAVNGKLGIDANNQGDWPAGLVAHAAGVVPKGIVVIEAWESKAAQQSFMAERLGAALAAAGVPAPAQVIETEPFNAYLAVVNPG